MSPSQSDQYKELLEACPIAVLEVDYSALVRLGRQLKEQTVTHIRQYLVEHPTLVKKTFLNVRILTANDAALEQFHAKNKKELTENFLKVFTTSALEILTDHFSALLEGEARFSGEFRYLLVKRQQRDAYLQLVVPKKSVKNLSHVVLTVQDISQWKRVERQLRKKAQLDGLTGLFNHMTIMQRLDQELDRAKRYGLSLSCLMIDLDHFKVINDKLGHIRGDVVLRRVAHMIRGCIRTTDIIGRYGGDEFLVLLPETTSQNAVHAAARIQRMFVDKISKAQKINTFNLSLSIGVAGYPSKQVKDRKDFIILADQAMYSAKKAGRNRIVTF